MRAVKPLRKDKRAIMQALHEFGVWIPVSSENWDTREAYEFYKSCGFVLEEEPLEEDEGLDFDPWEGTKAKDVRMRGRARPTSAPTLTRKERTILPMRSCRVVYHTDNPKGFPAPLMTQADLEKRRAMAHTGPDERAPFVYSAGTSQRERYIQNRTLSLRTREEDTRQETVIQDDWDTLVALDVRSTSKAPSCPCPRPYPCPHRSITASPPRSVKPHSPLIIFVK